MRSVHIVTRCGRVQGVFASARKARDARDKMRREYLPTEVNGQRGTEWYQAWAEEYDHWSVESHHILDGWDVE